MLRRLIAAMLVLASGCFAPAPLVAQGPPVRTAQWVATPAGGVSLTALQEAAARLGGTFDRPDAADPTFNLLRGPWSVLRDSIFAVSDTNRMAPAGRRVVVTGAWRRLFTFVELDQVIEVPRDSSSTLLIGDGAAPLEAAYWFQVLHGADQACLMGACGQGVKGGAADTGADRYHPEFAGRFLYGKDYGGGPDSMDVSDNLSGCNGHGTHVTSSIGGATVGGAKSMQVVHYRVMGASGCTAYSSSTTRALLDATRNGIDVMNVSIGHTQSYSMGQALLARKAAGFVTCGANGNDGSGPTLYWPAGDSSAVGSAAVDGGGNRAGFSRWGPATDFGSAGVGVYGAMPGGGYANKSGTSMGSPWTCANFAQVFSTPEFQAMPRTRAKVDSAQTLLCLSATRKPVGGRDDYVGCGVPNAARAIAMMRGGVAIAAPATDTILTNAPLPAQTCKPVVALSSWTATADVPWIRVTTTPDSLCYAIDPALVPRGASTVTGTITTRSN